MTKNWTWRRVPDALHYQLQTKGGLYAELNDDTKRRGFVPRSVRDAGRYNPFK